MARAVVMMTLLLCGGMAAARFVGAARHLPMLSLGYQPSGRSPMSTYAADASTRITVKVSPGEWPELIPTKFSPDGQWKVYFSDEGGNAGLHVGRTDGGSGRYITSTINYHWLNAWTADSQYFVYGQYFSVFRRRIQAQLVMVSADGRLMRELQQGIAPDFSISPNREWLIFSRAAAKNWHFYMMPFALEGRAQPLPLPFMYFNPIVWSPDSRHFIASRYGMAATKYSEPIDPYLVTLDPDVTSMPLTRVADGDFKWSPDSQYFAVLTNHPDQTSSLSIFELATGNVIHLRSKDGLDSAFVEFSDAFAWSPDSRWLVFRGLVDGELKMSLYSTHTEETLAVDIVSQGHAYYTWSPDSTWIAFKANEEINGEPPHVYGFHVPSRRLYPIVEDYYPILGWYTDVQAVLELRRACGQNCLKN